MKVSMLFVVLFAALIVPPFTDAAPRAKRAVPAGHTVRFDPVVREKIVITHIKQRLGSYGNSIVTDPRFAIDPAMFARPLNPKPAVPRRRPRRYDYDYVFSLWSKEQGRRFLENNVIAFNCEEREFGVPREVIDGVLNIETQWGQNMGKRPVVTTLYTLAVMRPDLIQPGWPEKQLIAFLSIFEDSDADLFSIKGSSTGAFGLPQFEPTSYPVLAVNCHDDDDDAPDLFDNGDAICSIGKYLSRAGWGSSEASHRQALFAYNHDAFYVGAILDYADWLAGKPSKHPRYQFFHPKKTEGAASK
jgi:membrane-bound lytic murein transglycosylase B